MALLRNHWIKDDLEEIVKDLLASTSLILRAAGYATIFNNISIESESVEAGDFFKQYPENSLDKWIGITNTSAFWLCDKYDSNGKIINDQMQASG